jgi:hypothetical protein
MVSTCLWRAKKVGARAFDYLIKPRKKYYSHRQRKRTLAGGDRVGILGRGITVVAWVDNSELSVVLWSNLTLTSPAGKLPGNRQNMRWETDANDKLLRERIVVQLGPLSRPNIS